MIECCCYKTHPGNYCCSFSSNKVGAIFCGFYRLHGYWCLHIFLGRLKKTDLTLTAWLGSHVCRVALRWRHIGINPIKNISLFHYICYFPQVAICYVFIPSLKTNLCTTLSRYNTTENTSINSQAQYTTAVLPHEFLCGTHQLLAINF